MITPLLELLDMSPQGNGSFIGKASHEDHVRAFGGHVLAQGLAAAADTVGSGRPASSLHAYFLSPGSTIDPIEYRVETMRDGRSFSLRSVEATQRGKALLQLSAAFHQSEVGAEHSGVMPDAPRPETLQSFYDRYGHRDDMSRWHARVEAFDIRFVGRTPFDEPAEPEKEHLPRQQMWIRFGTPIGDDPALHRNIFAYASDLAILDPILLQHRQRWTDRSILGASLDHAMWFHRPFRIDDWLLVETVSPTSFGARGLAQSKVWGPDGQLAVSVAQEALLRPPGKTSANK